VTVIDTSGVVDFLLGVGVADQVEALMVDEGELAAPDLLVFEVIAVLRRDVHRRMLTEDRAAQAVADLGDLPVELFRSLPLRKRAWSLHRNVTAADALFVALAELLEEPFATKDRPLAGELEKHASPEVLKLEPAD
jgi:predicted nucleic acid-binding protein